MSELNPENHAPAFLVERLVRPFYCVKARFGNENVRSSHFLVVNELDLFPAFLGDGTFKLTQRECPTHSGIIAQ